jgi:hypothetical protein
MASPGHATPGAETELRPGTGRKIRREYSLRAAVASSLAAGLTAIAIYGAYGVASNADSGVPFLVFGAAGALAQLALATAFLFARATITGDRYNKPAVARARKSISAVLLLLVAAVVVGFIIGRATLDAGLATLMAVGLIGVFGITADGWRHLRHLG